MMYTFEADDGTLPLLCLASATAGPLPGTEPVAYAAAITARLSTAAHAPADKPPMRCGPVVGR